MQGNWFLDPEIHLAYAPQRPLYLLLPSPGILFLVDPSQWLQYFTQVSPNVSPSEITTRATTLFNIILITFYSHFNSILFYFIALTPVIILYIYLFFTFFVISVKM